MSKSDQELKELLKDVFDDESLVTQYYDAILKQPDIHTKAPYFEGVIPEVLSSKIDEMKLSDAKLLLAAVIKKRKLQEFLQEIDLHKFFKPIYSELHVSLLDHFDDVEADDFERIGMGRPAVKRLLGAVKKQQQLIGLLEETSMTEYYKAIHEKPEVYKLAPDFDGVSPEELKSKIDKMTLSDAKVLIGTVAKKKKTASSKQKLVIDVEAGNADAGISKNQHEQEQNISNLKDNVSGVFNLSGLVSNTGVLVLLLEQESRGQYFWPLVIFISISVALQLIVASLLIVRKFFMEEWGGKYTSTRIILMIATILLLFITVANIFVVAFAGVATGRDVSSELLGTPSPM